MKTKIYLMVTACMVLTLSLHAQKKNYDPSKSGGKGVKIHGERMVLEDRSAKSKSIAAAVPVVAGLIADHGIGFIKDQLDKEVKKYVGEYSATSTLKDGLDASSVQVLTRWIKKRSSDSLDIASVYTLTPKINNEDSSFYFEISVDKFNYSKAKITSGYYFLDLTFEVGITYLNDKNEKITFTSQPVHYSIFDTKNRTHSISSKDLTTDRFPLPDRISEVIVKVTESNPCSVRLEEVKGFIENNEDLLTELLGYIKS